MTRVTTPEMTMVRQGDQDLDDGLVDAATVEETGRRGEQAGTDGAPDAGDEVHADDVERVVVAEPELQADGQGRQATGDDTEDDRAERAERATGRGDGDQTGDDTGGRADRGGVTVTQLLHDQPAEHGSAGGGGGVDPHQGRGAVGRELGARVEAEPAEPQQTRADHGERHVVRAHRDLAEADPLADDEGEHEPGDTGVDVHDGATGEVDRHDVGGAVGGPEDQAGQAGLVGREEATAPDHVGDREVGEGDPQAAEDEPGRELDAVGDGAADQGDGDDGEGQLEADEGELGDVAVALVAEGVDDRVGGAAQTEVLERVGDDAGDVVAAERHRVAVQDVDEADDAHGAERHHHHVEDRLGPGHAAVEQRQTGSRHEEDEGSAEDDERRGRVVDLVCCLRKGHQWCAHGDNGDVPGFRSPRPCVSVVLHPDAGCKHRVSGSTWSRMLRPGDRGTIRR